VLRIPGEAVQALPAGAPATFSLLVVDFLGTASAANYTFVRSDDAGGAAPRATLPGGASQSFSPSKGIKVQAALDQETLCAGKAVAFSWSLDPPYPGLAQPYTARDLVVPAAAALAAAGSSPAYVATLTVRFEGSAAATSARAVLAEALAPLVAKLSGTSGGIFSEQDVVLSAVGSFDPDSLDRTAGLAYSWQCSREDANPCMDGAGGGGGRGTAGPSRLQRCCLVRLLTCRALQGPRGCRRGALAAGRAAQAAHG
jgi:hypothetical protein